jgi:hypothetical protein
MGAELEPYWNYLYIKDSEYEMTAQMTGAMIYGVYQRRLSNRTMVLNFHIGGGIYSVLDYHFTYNDGGETEPMNVLIPAAGIGASFQWFIKKPFFAELGLDFIHMFSVDDPQPGYIRPSLGAGWQF